MPRSRYACVHAAATATIRCAALALAGQMRPSCTHAWQHGGRSGQHLRRPSSGVILDTCNDDDDDDGTFITPLYSNNFPAARSSSSRHWTCTALHHTTPLRSAPRARSRSPPASAMWHIVSVIHPRKSLSLGKCRVKYSTAQHGNGVVHG